MIISRKIYYTYKLSIIQAYGFQEVFLLRNLERMKIIKKQESRSNYEAINEVNSTIEIGI
jgi:hypothetical protein